MAIGPGSGLTRLQSTVGLLVSRMMDAVRGTSEADRVKGLRETRYKDTLEPTTLVLMAQLDRMFGRNQIIDGFVPPPTAFRAYGFGGAEPQGFMPAGAAPGQQPFGGGQMGRSISAAIKGDPDFRRRFEKVLGGTLVSPGQSGRVRVYDGPPFGTHSQFMGLASNAPAALNAAARGAGLPGGGQQLSGLLGGLQAFEQNVMALAKDLGNKSGTGQSQVPATTDPMQLAMQAVNDTANVVQGNNGAVLGTGLPISPALQAQMAGLPPAGTGNVIAGMQKGPMGTQQLSDTMKQQMLQQQLSTLRRMYEMVANILKSMHDMMKTAIDNIK